MALKASVTRSLSLLVVLALALAASVSFDAAPVRAESYAEAMARVQNQLRSKEPSLRAAAVDALCKTGDAAAVAATLDIMTKELSPAASKAMGESFRHFRSEKAFDSIEKRVPKLTGIGNAFIALYAMRGLLLGATERGDAVVSGIIADPKSKEHYLRAAALEAVGDTNRGALSGAVETLIKNRRDEWEAAGVAVPVTATATATRIANADNKFALVAALADMLEFYKNERVKYFAASACAAISNEKPYYDPYFWRHWVAKKGDLSGKNAPGKGRTDDRKVPKFFDAEAVGKRVVFVIDQSGSMAGKVNAKAFIKPKPEKKEEGGPVTGKGGKDKEKKDAKEKKEPDPPDYSKVQTKLDLAKVELIYTLEQLDETFTFNVVVYAMNHDYLIPKKKGFLVADKANIAEFVAKVKALTPTSSTNIHGALMRAFRNTGEGAVPPKEDPALNADAMLTGADTIFFLTDGVPTHSDDSIDGNPLPADDPLRTSDGILSDIKRVNTFRRVVLHTVGIGAHARDLLSGLASNSGGVYRDMTGATGE